MTFSGPRHSFCRNGAGPFVALLNAEKYPMAAESSIATPDAPVDLHGKDLVITRVFDAPRRRVWQAWTEAEHLARWFAPRTSSVRIVTGDARPGGTLHFCHRYANGDEVWVKGTYREVDEGARLVLDGGFSDAAGNFVERPGFFGQTRIAVTFADEAGGTRVTIRQSGLDADRGESQGWREQLDRLAGHLATSGG